MASGWRAGGSVELLIHADPDAIYRVITDVNTTGERSRECWSAAWLPGGPQSAQVGARFRGRNRARHLGWSRVCEVVAAEPGRCFAFRTVPARIDLTRADSSTWRYELEAQADGTLVRHSYEITRWPLGPLKTLYGLIMPQHKDARPAMEYTLRRLAETLGAGTQASPE